MKAKFLGPFSSSLRTPSSFIKQFQNTPKPYATQKIAASLN